MIGELTNHLWRSTFCAMAAMLLSIALRKSRAQIRYWLWLSASFKFLFPFSLLMELGHHLEWTHPTKKIVTISSTVVQIAQPFPNGLSFTPPAPNSINGLLIALCFIWACGSGLIVLIRLRDWLRIRAAVRLSTPTDLPAKVPIRSSSGVLEPGVVGFVRPIVLMPAGIVERLTPNQL